MIQAMSAEAAPTRVMVVDDDAGYARLLVDCFSGLGFQVRYVESGAEALSEIPTFHPEIVLLDIRMPEMDGFEVCQNIRQNSEYANIIIIMLTSVGEVEDKIKGLKVGADDYLTKPFDFDELLARIEALVRRSQNFAPSSNVLQVADLVLDRELLEVRRGDETIKLTAKELAILELLMSAPGRVFSRTRILNQVWGYSEDPLTNVVDVYIARLRRKIDTPGREPLLETVRGHGYRLKAPA